MTNLLPDYGLERPEMVSDTHLRFLSDLRSSGVTNMLGAPAYLRDAWPEMSRAESFKICGFWERWYTAKVRDEHGDAQ